VGLYPALEESHLLALQAVAHPAATLGAFRTQLMVIVHGVECMVQIIMHGRGACDRAVVGHEAMQERVMHATTVVLVVGPPGGHPGAVLVGLDVHGGDMRSIGIVHREGVLLAPPELAHKERLVVLVA